MYRIDWGNTRIVPIFYGRERELSQVSKWILEEHQQLVGVFGIGGIGKTTLIVKLVENINTQFDYVFWRSLRNAPPVDTLLDECLRFFSGEAESKLPQTTNERISALIEYFRNYRCLFVIDDVESLLQQGIRVGHYRHGYAVYGELIQQVAELTHQSCLIIIGREKPEDFDVLRETVRPVRVLHLSGLGSTVAETVLKDAGLSGSQDDFIKLAQLYSGNPLALRIVANNVNQIYAGSISDFLSETADGKSVFGTVADVLDNQFHRLSALERFILHVIAIERGSTSLEHLQLTLAYTATTHELSEALGSLRQRSWVEQMKGNIVTQPVVTEYVLSRFKDFLANMKEPSPSSSTKKATRTAPEPQSLARRAVQIFISYAREDEEEVSRIYQELLNRGFKPWMDKFDLLPGEKWKLSIRKAMERSDFILVCLSPQSVNKRGFLQNEIQYALDLSQQMLDTDIHLIPARLQECQVPEKLRDFQWINLFDKNGWSLLFRAIQSGLERRQE